MFFSEKQIGCLPITENERLVGILTESDILSSLVELIGANQPSSNIEVRVKNQTGQLADVAAIFKKHNINIVSVLIYPGKAPEYKLLVFRVQTIDPRRVINDIQNEGFEVTWPKIPGMFS